MLQKIFPRQTVIAGKFCHSDVFRDHQLWIKPCVADTRYLVNLSARPFTSPASDS